MVYVPTFTFGEDSMLSSAEAIINPQYGLCQ